MTTPPRTTIFVLAAGFAAPWLWACLLMEWGLHITSTEFRAIHRFTGMIGQPLVIIDGFLFSLCAALAFSMMFIVALRYAWPWEAVRFSISFVVGMFVQSFFVGSSLSFLLTYSTLWLFLLFFCFFCSVGSRWMAGPVRSRAE